MKRAIIILSLLLCTAPAQAVEYTYETVQPGDVYYNNYDVPVQIRVKKIDDKTKYEKARDTMYQTTNAANDVVNNVRAFTSLFGLY